MIFLISHRGNINGPNPNMENKKSYIESALNNGYDVEIDVWYENNQFWLGHNNPTEKIEKEFLKNPHLWCHAKNIEVALEFSSDNSIHYFWHQNDDISITSKGFLWTHSSFNILTKQSIAVLPELNQYTSNQLKTCVGICSDYIKDYK